MELKDILTISFATLIVLVIAHIAVFWVVRTLYPPVPVSAPVPVPVVAAPPVFTQPPVTEQQDVHIPTYQASPPTQTSQQEGSTSLADLQDPTIQRNTGVVAP